MRREGKRREEMRRGETQRGKKKEEEKEEKERKEEKRKCRRREEGVRRGREQNSTEEEKRHIPNIMLPVGLFLITYVLTTFGSANRTFFRPSAVAFHDIGEVVKF